MEASILRLVSKFHHKRIWVWAFFGASLTKTCELRVFFQNFTTVYYPRNAKQWVFVDRVCGGVVLGC